MLLLFSCILRRQNYNQTKKFDEGTRKAIKLIIIKYRRGIFIVCAFAIVKMTKEIYFAYFCPLDCSGWNNRLVLTQTKICILCLISPHNKFISRWPASKHNFCLSQKDIDSVQELIHKVKYKLIHLRLTALIKYLFLKLINLISIKVNFMSFIKPPSFFCNICSLSIYIVFRDIVINLELICVFLYFT